MYIGLHVKYRYSCQILNNFEFSQQSFEKYISIKFYGNPSSGGRDVPCGQTDTHDETKSLFATLRTRLRSCKHALRRLVQKESRRAVPNMTAAEPYGAAGITAKGLQKYILQTRLNRLSHTYTVIFNKERHFFF
jgi:hypothetical protein